ncbi:hypothetical protein Acor_63820 [Acrocarpospora corrugata]|uniref:RCC1-like domain-containing protein n=1 Tax=Acrocarpospora corrugata TaxID=35763 RepID=A0A5M3W688_9ACTN|nr:hypothetical protein Acor_63820 [Acrocarpospora corrugata]
MAASLVATFASQPAAADVQYGSKPYAWGSNEFGQFADGTVGARPTPGPIPGLDHFTKIAAGWTHTLAIGESNSVWTWGSNEHGELGNGTTSTGATIKPARVDGLTGVVDVSAGWGFSMAVTADGTVWTWGDNARGQLGDGTHKPRTLPVPVTQSTGLPAIAAVSAGRDFSTARTETGEVWTWGANSEGTLGLGVTGDRPTPSLVTSLTGVRQISAGGRHVLALRTDGRVWGWGDNGAGQLATSVSNDALSPVPVFSCTCVDVAAGGMHSLAVRSDRTLWSWGHGAFGELGDGLAMGRSTPKRIAVRLPVVDAAAGHSFSLAVSGDGRLWTTGRNAKGQLGNGTFTQGNVFTTGPGLHHVAQVTAGRDHTVAVTF